MTASGEAGGTFQLPPDVIAEVAGACGRGYTVICTLPDADLLAALASAAGATGLVLSPSDTPPSATGAPTWRAVRCRPDLSIPLRSHVVDLAVITDAPDLAGLCEEVRRALAPGADVRVLTHGDPASFADALRGASISPRRTTAHNGIHLIAARGP